MTCTGWRLGVSVRRFFVRLGRDGCGQDLIEYALLTAIVAVSTIVILGAFSGKMENAYNGWNTATQNAWEPCPPLSSGLPCS